MKTALTNDEIMYEIIWSIGPEDDDDVDDYDDDDDDDWDYDDDDEDF